MDEAGKSDLYPASAAGSGLSPAESPRAEPSAPRSGPPPKPPNDVGPSSKPTTVASGPNSRPVSSGVVMTPMRIIEVKGGAKGPPPMASGPSAPPPLPAPPTPAGPQDSPQGYDSPTPPETPALRRELLRASAAGASANSIDTDVSPQTAPSPGASTEAYTPGPPPVPAVVDLDSPPPSDEHLETISEEDLTELTPQAASVGSVEVPPRKKRRSLPPRPPPRSAFSDGTEVPKKKQWWEEMFGEDFERTGYDQDPRQLVRTVDFIIDSLALKPGALVLDLACGDGAISVELAKRGFRVVGVDVSTPQLARARERAARGAFDVEFIKGDMRELDYDGVFDAVLCWDASFGYFEEEKNQAVLRHVYRALKLGGTFLLDVPNRDFVVEQQPSQNWFEGDACV
ncbi:MAG: hypothetical protein RJA70_1335, partial [Pseudomonadota bacterium]